MTLAIWTQWDDLEVPAGFEKLSPKNFPLDDSDLSKIDFYVPTYMSGKVGLEYTRQMKNLKYLQMPNAGFEDALPYAQSGIILCNARGVHDASTAELAIGLAIAARRGFADFATAQQRGEWAHRRYQSLNDSKIAIIGAGSIGNMLSHYLSVYDVEISSFSRSGSNGSSKISEFDNQISKFDVIFLILPLNEDSRNFIDTSRLKAMKQGATLVNVARGAIVNTDALVEALNSGHINAGLDVTEPEPLPAGHALWSARNCVISPHVGGDSTAFDSRCKKLVQEQLIRLANNLELINIVN